MDFKVNSKILEKLLSRVIPAVPVRTPMPILENFLFELKDGQLNVCATDLEVSLRSSINVAASEDLSIVVPARLIYEVIRSLEDTQINFSFESNSKLKLTTDKGTYFISYSPSEDFPEIPSVSMTKEILINGKDMKKAIDQTSFAMSKEDMRPAMTGTLLEFTPDGLKFVTTDGHRLVRFINKNIKTGSEEHYIVPERAIAVLTKLLGETDVKIYLGKSNILFNIADIEFISRLIGEKYPAYNSVIPLENENLLKVNRAELISTIKRMMLFSSSGSKQVKFSISKDSLTVSSEDIDLGSSGVENLTCEYKGDSMDIGFNTQYVNDILTHLDDDEVMFKLHSPTKACIIEPEDVLEGEEIMLLLMPVRLNS
ncbi:MAG: DNA polymerase III subunit beta [Ignavibacteria bacterium]|nr:DNA polymerase III subunit beta [Ignavibacteria bacterium]MBT8381495.1 DNA polymerase III subunit beta [Ignavibacteria bacterium]MBT8391557.1 DNA polymerase III subunit beta [Ignavibacteria bacterium]NNJ52249.1 DNA polymerase III subunit beta [Ignavibacteriaceae bacterium]NNL22726.1 DNA polymerase III subunit beta [Ignavibacteriaceae bacterium]